MDAPLDTFRPSTLGWLMGTLAGWGTILLGLAGIVLAVMGLAGFGIYWLALTAAALGDRRLEMVRRTSPPNMRSPRSG